MNVLVFTIRTEKDYQRGLREVERLMEENPSLGTADSARLEILGALVEDDERKHEPVPPVDPIEVILFYMEQHGHTQRDLVRVFGSRARVWEVLHRRRSLTLDMIRKLHAEYGIPADLLIETSGSSSRPMLSTRFAHTP